MKKLTLLITVLVVAFTTTFAQNIPITGEFKTHYDTFGNASIYFEGKNISYYPIYNISVLCVNEVLGQKRDFFQKVLLSGHSFYIGISQNWVWQSGEKLYLTVNGQTVYWQYGKPPKSNYSKSRTNTNTNTNTKKRTMCTRCNGSGDDPYLYYRAPHYTTDRECCSYPVGHSKSCKTPKVCITCKGLGYTEK